MLLRLLQMVARRRTARSSSGLWTALSLAIFLLRRYQERSSRDDVVLREVLQPGESLLISDTGLPRR
jgi:hypothetical protein